MKKILISIINKNRSLFLTNLIESYEKNFKINYFEKKLLVLDSSDNNKQIEIVNKLVDKFQLILMRPSINLSDGYLGKLYHKMNMALKYAIKNEYDYIFFLQEDTQFVRKITKEDLKSIEQIFNSKNIIHITTHFVKAFDINVTKHFKYQKKNNYYLNKKSSASDIGIYDVQKIKKLKFSFLQSETLNDNFLLKCGYNSCLLFNPMVNYLPWPTSARRYSGAKKNKLIVIIRLLLIMINDLGTRSGFHPYEDMTDHEFKKMNSRNKYELPVGEFFLKTKTKTRKPWSFDRVWDFRKFKNYKYIFNLSWIFAGSIEYINNVEQLDRIGLKNKYKREIEDE